MSIRSPNTKQQYPRRLKQFFDHIGIEQGNNSLEEQAQNFLKKAGEEPEYWVEDSILLYLNYHKDRVEQTNEITAGTLRNFYQPIAIFCRRHKHSLPHPIDWEMLSQSLPPAKTAASDRAPSVEEIRKLVEYPDRRLKPLVYVTCSSGIRLGAWKYLRWKHVTPKIKNKIKNNNNSKDEEEVIIVVAAKLKVYAGKKEEYDTFITPEAYNALKDYFDIRARHGEKITGESFLIRDDWRDSDTKIGWGGGHGLAAYPKKLELATIAKIVTRALYAQGLRFRLQEGERRHEFKGFHGFRKFFETQAPAAGMNIMYVLLLLDPGVGLSASYLKPTEQQLLSDYLRAVPSLTVNLDAADKSILQKQVAELTEKSEHENSAILERLAQRDRQIEKMQKELAAITEALGRSKLVQDFDRAQREYESHHPRSRRAREAAEEELRQMEQETIDKVRLEEKALKAFGEDVEDVVAAI